MDEQYWEDLEMRKQAAFDQLVEVIYEEKLAASGQIANTIRGAAGKVRGAAGKVRGAAGKVRGDVQTAYEQVRTYPYKNIPKNLTAKQKAALIAGGAGGAGLAGGAAGYRIGNRNQD